LVLITLIYIANRGSIHIAAANTVTGPNIYGRALIAVIATIDVRRVINNTLLLLFVLFMFLDFY
jgi:hypothetical protein